MLIFIGFFEKYIFDKFLKNKMQTDFKIVVLVKIYIIVQINEVKL